MLYVNSDKTNNYYVDFDKLTVFIVDKVSRVAKSVKIKFDPIKCVLNYEHKLNPEISAYLIAMYFMYIQNTDRRLEIKKLERSISHDLNDDACRDFNSFG